MSMLTDIILAQTAWYSLKVMGALPLPREAEIAPDISRQVNDIKKKFVALPFPADILYVGYKIAKMYHHRETTS